MAKTTDPAMELALVLERLANGSDLPGSRWLASQFNVDEWSLEFYQIIFSIIQRMDILQKFIEENEQFDDLRSDLKSRLSNLRSAFDSGSLAQVWSQRGIRTLNTENIRPVKMCSAYIRTRISYADLSDDEVVEIVDACQTLLSWLNEHQLDQDDFIRQAIIEGINSFVFRMERLKWLGWGYSLDSLKSVIMAYCTRPRNRN